MLMQMRGNKADASKLHRMEQMLSQKEAQVRQLGLKVLGLERAAQERTNQLVRHTPHQARFCLGPLHPLLLLCCGCTANKASIIIFTCPSLSQRDHHAAFSDFGDKGAYVDYLQQGACATEMSNSEAGGIDIQAINHSHGVAVLLSQSATCPRALTVVTVQRWSGRGRRLPSRSASYKLRFCCRYVPTCVVSTPARRQLHV